MIVGIGVDVAEISRLDTALRRTPALAERLFAESERGVPIPSLAGYFAAKEATAKALGVTAWHLSISHDAGVCIAMVVAER